MQKNIYRQEQLEQSNFQLLRCQNVNEFFPLISSLPLCSFHLLDLCDNCSFVCPLTPTQVHSQLPESCSPMWASQNPIIPPAKGNRLSSKLHHAVLTFLWGSCTIHILKKWFMYTVYLFLHLNSKPQDGRKQLMGFPCWLSTVLCSCGLLSKCQFKDVSSHCRWSSWGSSASGSFRQHP